MAQGDVRAVRESNLRLGAVVAEIEGLYTAALRTGHPARRAQLLAQLAEAGERLAELSASPAGDGSFRPSRSRWGQRRSIAARGAEWIIDRCAR